MPSGRVFLLRSTNPGINDLLSHRQSSRILWKECRYHHTHEVRSVYTSIVIPLTLSIRDLSFFYAHQCNDYFLLQPVRAGTEVPDQAILRARSSNLFSNLLPSLFNPSDLEQSVSAPMAPSMSRSSSSMSLGTPSYSPAAYSSTVSMQPLSPAFAHYSSQWDRDTSSRAPKPLFSIAVSESAAVFNILLHTVYAMSVFGDGATP